MGAKGVPVPEQRTDQDVAVEAAVPVDPQNRSAIGATAGGFQLFSPVSRLK